MAVIAIAFLTFVLAGGLNPSQQTQIDGSTILLFLVMYLPVAVLRARDIGFSWWSSVVITLVVGALFVPFLIIWLGTAKSTAGLPLWQANWNKLFLVGIAVFIAIMAVIVVVAITMVPQPSGANPPNQPGLTVCDTWLRAQLNSSTATPNTNATNDAIEAIQAGRPAQCPPGAWNPVVNDLGRDHLGNIDVKFWTTNKNLRGTAVTMPADGKPRWVYLAEKKQWYSSKLDDRSVLTTPPTASNQSAPNPTTARPNYTSRPPTTDPMSLLMWITEGGVGSIGEIGSIGQGLDCDNLLQQQLLASPLATANADNANAVIAGIQSQRPVVCPPDIWNPWVVETAGFSGFSIHVPPTLSVDGLAGVNKRFAKTPLRDQFGNIGVDFDTATTVRRGAPTTLPVNRSPRWMYLSHQGVWYGSGHTFSMMPTSAPSRLPTPAPAPYDVMEIVEAYFDNQVAAKQKYDDRPLLVQGTVREIREQGIEFTTLHTMARPGAISYRDMYWRQKMWEAGVVSIPLASAAFEPGNLHQLASLTRTQKVTLLCDNVKQLDETTAFSGCQMAGEKAEQR